MNITPERLKGFACLGVLIFCIETHADNPVQFLAEWQALIHIGVMQCNYHIDHSAAMKAGNKIFLNYFNRMPTIEERLIARIKKSDMALRYYAYGGITCGLVARNLGKNIFS